MASMLPLSGPKLVYIPENNKKKTTWEYKNPSWVWGWDRKICPEDHRLASQGLPSDDSDHVGQIFWYLTIVLLKNAGLIPD